MENQNTNNSFELWLESVGGHLPSKQTMTTRNRKLRFLANFVIVFLVLIVIALSLRLVENKFASFQGQEEENIEVRASEVKYENIEESNFQYNRDRFASLTRKLLGIKTVYAVEVLNPNYTAIKLIQSERGEIEMTAGSTKTITVGYKNTGKKTWHIDGSTFVSLYASSPSSRTSPFEHSSWQEDGFYSRTTRLKNNWVRPGNIGFFSFEVQAPEQAGTYHETYKLAIENYCWIEGSDIALDFKVVARPVSVYRPTPSSTSAAPSSSRTTIPQVVQATQFIDEPILRVGLHDAPEAAVITSALPYEVLDSNGKVLFSRPGNGSTLAIFDRVNNKYIIEVGANMEVTRQPVRFVGQQKDQIFEITNYERRLGNYNFNKYRGVLEFSYSSSSDTVWIINELSLEDYLKGIDETSDASPLEFQKALIVAARSYAYHHFESPTKHARDNFTVNALYDQIYRGVVAENKHPKVSQAVAATRGVIVAYNDEPVFTPYFSQSDGRTRSYQEVWRGGPYPWLVSVPDPHNQGKELLGHGVGMSAQGALEMAYSENKNFVEILQYYYQSTQIQKIYN